VSRWRPTKGVTSFLGKSAFTRSRDELTRGESKVELTNERQPGESLHGRLSRGHRMRAAEKSQVP
jgi:hypothetical protein